MGRLLLLFIVVPFVELAILLWLADITTWQFTLALIIVTGIVGSALARVQGWKTWRKIQTEMAAGRMPGDALVEGLLIQAAGLLLITPGILTDVFGFSLLIPGTRRWYRRRLTEWFKKRFVFQQMSATPWQTQDPNTVDSFAEPGQDEESIE